MTYRDTYKKSAKPFICTISNGIIAQTSGSTTTSARYLYNGKEKQTIGDVNYLDYGARMYDESIGRWTTQDPLREKYYETSPYTYCGNNPILLIDIEGKTLVISGILKDNAFNQIKSNVGNSLKLSIDKKGTISYSLTDKKVTKGAARLMEIIDNGSVTVNLKTTNSNYTSSGNFFVGGAFMGNEVITSEDGKKTANAYQEVNPTVLGKADSFTKTPGKMIMHEVTEAYEGAQIAIKNNTIGTLPAFPSAPRESKKFIIRHT